MITTCLHPDYHVAIRDCDGTWVQFDDCPDCGFSDHKVLGCSHPNLEIEEGGGVYSEICPDCGYIYLNDDALDDL